MKRYYFDVRNANGLTMDGEGYDFPDLAAVQWEAVLSLIDHSRDTCKEAIELPTDLAINVRDDAGPVMEVTLKFHGAQKN